MTDTRTTQPATAANEDNAAAKTTARQGSVATKPVAAARKVIEDSTEAVRNQANMALEASVAAVDNAPLTALAGAIALGAVTAALLPNTTREVETLGPLGQRARGALDSAFAAAKAAGAEQLTAKGLTAAATTSGIGSLIGSIVKAAIAANGAANESMRTAPDASAKAQDKPVPVAPTPATQQA